MHIQFFTEPAACRYAGGFLADNARRTSMMNQRSLAGPTLLASALGACAPPVAAPAPPVVTAAPLPLPPAPASATPPAPPPRVTALAAGTHATCARLADGTARCWGRVFYTSYGEALPDPRQAGSAEPVAVAGLDGVTALALGTFYACALRGGGVVCWGVNGSAALGHGERGNRYAPTPVAGLSGVMAIAAAPDHACALLGSGAAYCWGSNFYGALGTSVKGATAYAPVKVEGLAGAVAIATGHTHTCAALADGSARCWGANRHGQLGDGTKTDRAMPAAVRDLAGVVELALGDATEVPVEARLLSGHSCARLRDESVWCWGENRFGQLGDGTRADRAAPVKVAGIEGARAVAAGTGFTCALHGEGTVACWGSNMYGQLGDGTSTTRARPAKVNGITAATAIAARGLHACALLQDGSVWCWGRAEMARSAAEMTQAIPRRVVF